MKKGLLLAVFVAMVLFLVPGVAMAEYTQDLVPEMTSNTAPSGVAEASSVYGDNPNYMAYKAFDNIISIPGWASYVDQPMPQWLSYQFTSEQIINKYTIRVRNDETISVAPVAWTFEGWNGSAWVVLDSRSNINDWTLGEKKEFTFSNTNAYQKYRINISANGGYNHVEIYEMEMMGEVVSTPSAPTNLTATAGDTQVSLGWDAVTGATSYKVKRATTSGGTYTEIATGVTTASYTDTGLTNGTTYYYVVTAVNSGGESGNSNEASATPSGGTTPPSGGDDALLVITMTNGMEKEYQMSTSEVSSFISWYNTRAGGSGSAYYMISKSYNLGPFSSRKDYIVFDKILSFEVMEY